MKFCKLEKDGGEESHVWGYFLIEIKSLFSIVLLRFEDGSRPAHHTHAFNCFSWLLSGLLIETFQDRAHHTVIYTPGWRPFVTRRDDFHKVDSMGRSWVLTFRGPWATTWKEATPDGGIITLTHGREEVG